MGLPISSVEVAADAISNSLARSDCSTRCFIIYSAIGERQMLP